MVHLGLWQIDRLHQKEERIARFSAAQRDVDPVSIGYVWRYRQSDAWDYHRTRFTCQQVQRMDAVAGRNARGGTGWAHVARCLTMPVAMQGFRPDGQAQGVLVDVVIGWSARPDAVAWAGGEVRGTIVPGGEFAHHVVADPPLAGLAANAVPDPQDMPNNHFSYAVQWFLFALVALVIYGLALRRRWREHRAALA
ncbi:MAG TPA: SURF1 family cytochrome oxidase biogenesis protein, partial [Novosphingobium sp.]|nr:SURF1 family cytochrome oxidase biogenesis protein [Novosphingobium sp.]